MTQSEIELAARRVGQRIAGKLRLERVLGVGGMGAVYAAVNEATQRRFAVKLVFPEHTRDAVGRERITREATAPNEIDHPGLVDVYDAGTDDDGTVYLCMELLEGQTLRDWLASSESSLGAALSHLRSAIEPLAAAHAKGFVHRDLKPENLFLTRDRVKLLDFGLVRRMDAASASTTGATIGTAHYMSPEQARGSSQATSASDVWSFGVMLYEIVAGRRPFEGASAVDVMMKAAAEEPPDLAELAPDVPASLISLTQDCLRKDPAGRPKDASALAARFAGVMADVEAAGAAGRAIDHAHFASGQTVALGDRGGTLPMAARPAPSSPAVPKTTALPPAEAEPDLAGAGLKSSWLPKVAVLAIVIVIAAAIGGALLILRSASYDPTKVAIGIRGGGGLAPRLLESFDVEIRRVGFSTTRAGDLGADARRTLITRAAAEGCAHAILFELTAERVRDGLTSDTGYFRHGLRASVIDTATEEDVRTLDLAFGAEAVTESELDEGLLSVWVHAIGPELLEILYARPSLVEARRSSTDVEIAARALALTNHAEDVEITRQARESLATRCAQMGTTLEAANASATPRVHCYGDPCGETYLVGLTADSIVVQIESSVPYLNFQGEARMAETEERLERVSLANGSAAILATSSNYYGIAGLASASGIAVAVEQGRARNGALVAVDVASGARRVVRVLGPGRAPDAILPSLDANAMFMSTYGAMTMARGGEEPRPIPRWRLSGATWLSLPALGVPQVLAAYDPAADVLVLLQDDGNVAIDPANLVGRFRGIAGAKDDLLYLVHSDATGCFVSRLDPATASLVSTTHLSECVSQPRLLTDGRLVGLAETHAEGDTPGDPEIVIADQSGDVRPLTRGTYREVNPQVASTGTHIAFERHLDNPDGAVFGSRRSVVCWLDAAEATSP